MEITLKLLKAKERYIFQQFVNCKSALILVAAYILSANNAHIINRAMRMRILCKVTVFHHLLSLLIFLMPSLLISCICISVSDKRIPNFRVIEWLKKVDRALYVSHVVFVRQMPQQARTREVYSRLGLVVRLKLLCRHAINLSGQY